MAKVRKKKSLQEAIEGTKKPYSPADFTQNVNPMLGSLAGLNAGMQPEGMKQQIDSIEMKKQTAPTPAPMPKAKVKVKPEKQKDPPGTFRNVDNELVVGDMRRFLEWQKSQKK